MKIHTKYLVTKDLMKESIVGWVKHLDTFLEVLLNLNCCVLSISTTFVDRSQLSEHVLNLEFLWIDFLRLSKSQLSLKGTSNIIPKQHVQFSCETAFCSDDWFTQRRLVSALQNITLEVLSIWFWKCQIEPGTFSQKSRCPTAELCSSFPSPILSWPTHRMPYAPFNMENL